MASRSISAAVRCRARCTSPPDRSRSRSECAPTCATTTPWSARTGLITSRSPRASARQARGRVVRQGRRPQPRQGRSHAPVRPRAKLLVQRHRGGEPAAGDRRRARVQEARRGLRRGGVLRRGRGQPGDVPRGAQPRGLWNLPVVFICEDNRWAISVPKGESTAIASNADRAAGYGMPGVSVDHNDAVEVFAAAGEAIDRARQGGGPTLIEVQTDRYLGHFQGDAEVYRPKGEPDELRANDPIPELAATMREQGVLDDAPGRADPLARRAARDRGLRVCAREPAAGSGRGARARLRLEEEREHGGCDQGTHAHDGPGDLRGDRPGDGARRARVRDGRGRRQLRRHLQRHQRAARPVRSRADHGHADQRGRLHRRRCRRRGSGAAADRGADVRRLLRRVHGPDLQPPRRRTRTCRTATSACRSCS